ncbi:MAG: hypothetical protein BWY17_03582 [Deltaproteobacteria bacterium ADurb.Bin207]|jgi:MYXO-CTERM domain-containing protein|nr:MAG: hypothetical protein BWY17_03582 [Deltaproteobacteria bacterium ADurb.Bin207]
MHVSFVDVDSASYGSYVGVYGKGFGDTKGQISFGGATSIDMPLWSDSLIIAKIPAGAQTGIVKVTAGSEQAESPESLKIHSGAIFVVSSAGSDSNSGDTEHPFQTLHKAMSVVQPGDTVLIQAGAYDEPDLDTSIPLPAMYFRNNSGGTAEKPITWRGYGADVPVIRASHSLSSTSPVLLVEGEYLRFARIEINGTNNTSSGVSVWASNTWVVGLDVHSFGETGILVGETDATMVAANRIHNGGTRADLDHGILMLGQHATIRNNDISDLPNGYGIFLQYQSQEFAYVFENFIHDIAGGGIGLSRVGGNNRIFNNIVWKAGLSQGCRCALQVAYGQAASEPSSTDRIYYNTFVGPGVAGLFVADREGSIEMHGNIFSEFKAGIRIDDTGPWPYLSTSHNLWHGQKGAPQFKLGGPWIDFAQFQSQTGQEDGSLVADPKLVDPEAGDMHLSAGSPAIRAGGGPDRPASDFDGVARPSEAVAPDMGALQFDGPGGSGGSAGSGGSGGDPDSGSAGSGAEAGSGGSSEGGSGNASGSGGSGGGASAGKGAASQNDTSDDDGGGCGCTTPSSPTHSPLALLVALGALAWRRRR